MQFDRDITYCQPVVSAYNVTTFGRTDTFADAANTRVRVNLYNPAGAATDSWFYLQMSC